MKIDTETQGGIRHFKIDGKLDQFESILLRTKIMHEINAGFRKIVCDMSGIDLINSLGLGTIAPAIRAMETMGGQVLFYGFKSPSFKATFEKAKIFQTFNTYEEAVKYAIGMAEPLNVIICESRSTITDFFRNNYLDEKRKPKDYLISNLPDQKLAWEHIKKLYETKKRQVVIIDADQDRVLDFANRVKGFPIEGASVPVILVVGERTSADIESALDIADAFVQKPLNKPLFQKTFDAVASSV